MERRSVKRLVALLVLAAIVFAIGAGGVLWRGRGHDAKIGAAGLAPKDVRAPDSVRVRVQVLNGTKTRGLARRATNLLRDRGFDVVEMGTQSDGPDTTIVYDYTGHPEWAQRVAKIFQPARVEARPDTSRYLDVAVVLGSTWRPPAESFHP